MLQTRRKCQVHALLLIFVNTADSHLSAELHSVLEQSTLAHLSLLVANRASLPLAADLALGSRALASGSRLCLWPRWRAEHCLVITRYLLSNTRGTEGASIYTDILSWEAPRGKILVSHFSLIIIPHWIEHWGTIYYIRGASVNLCTFGTKKTVIYYFDFLPSADIIKKNVLNT